MILFLSFDQSHERVVHKLISLRIQMQSIRKETLQIRFNMSSSLPHQCPHIKNTRIVFRRYFFHGFRVLSRGLECPIELLWWTARCEFCASLNCVHRRGRDQNDFGRWRVVSRVGGRKGGNKLGKVSFELFEGNMLRRRRDARVVCSEPDGEDPDFGDMLLLVLFGEDLVENGQCPGCIITA